MVATPSKTKGKKNAGATAGATEATEVENGSVKKQQLIFSKAGKGDKEACYLFGDMVDPVAAVLAMEPGTSKKDQPMLVVPAAQFEAVKAKLEDAGYAIAVEAATNKPVVELRLFKGRERSGANIFGDAAKVVAEALGVRASLTRKNEFYITINADQISTAVDALSDAGFTARQLKEWVVIKYPNGRYCFLKAAAEAAGEHFGLATETSQSNNAKLTVTSEQYGAFRAIAKQQGYYFKELSPAEMDSRKQA